MLHEKLEDELQSSDHFGGVLTVSFRICEFLNSDLN